MKKSYFSLGLFLALGLIISTIILSDTYQDTRTLNTITVKGYAELPIESDMAMWTITVRARANDISQAARNLSADMDKLERFVRGFGFSSDEITKAPVNTSFVYATGPNGYTTNSIIGTIASQTVSLYSQDVVKIQELSVAISELLEQGIELETYSPRYDFTALNSIKMELLAKATENAFQRAKVIAENGDSEVGALRFASQGVFQITSSGSNEVSDYGIIDQTSIGKLAKAVVTAEFAIED